jgi:thioredoxin reductase
MYDVIIIGAGPAGGSAALFTSKAAKKLWLSIAIKVSPSGPGSKTIMV